MIWIASFYVVMSLVALTAMGIDKRAAYRGSRRISEARLHLIEFIGGFPGSLLGQKLFKHKRRKSRYFLKTWLFALVHIGAWIVWWWLL